MAVSDLLRTIRFGGAQGRAAASSLLDSARAGALRPNEVVEVKQLLATPELKDVFKDGLGQSLQAAIGTSPAPVRDVKALLPRPETLTDPKTLAQRFAADLTLMHGQVLDPRVPPDAHADRLMGFFAAYAERFVEMTRDPRPDAPITKLPPQEEAKVLRQFEKALADHGFAALKDTATGRDGLVLAKSLLESKSVDELRQRTKELALEAPPRKDPTNPHAATAIAVSAAHQRLLQKRKEEEDAEASRRGRRGRLGSNMLWNVLHLFRDGPSTPEETEAVKRLLVTAGLLLLFAVIVLTVFLMTL